MNGCAKVLRDCLGVRESGSSGKEKERCVSSMRGLSVHEMEREIADHSSESLTRKMEERMALMDLVAECSHNLKKVSTRTFLLRVAARQVVASAGVFERTALSFTGRAPCWNLIRRTGIFVTKWRGRDRPRKSFIFFEYRSRSWRLDCGLGLYAPPSLFALCGLPPFEEAALGGGELAQTN